MHKYIGLSFALLAVMTAGGQAETLSLKGNKHWLTVASTQDLDTAIGIAREFRFVDKGAKVASSDSGYYAIILGPYEGSSIQKLKKKDENIPDLPKDALLSNGDKYKEIVWAQADQGTNWTYYKIDQPAKLSSGDYSFEAKLDQVSDSVATTTVTGGFKGASEFTFVVDKEGKFSPQSPGVAVVKLDPKLDTPQLAFTRFAGGAHCCTKTWIAFKPSQNVGWSLIDQPPLDGDGYWFEDVDGDGAQELLSVDNRFLYAFDSYAGSLAPLRIAKLRNGSIDDVTDEPAMRKRLIQDVAGAEYEAKVRPDLWQENGFLAGWVANKIRLGEGDAAWARVASNMKEDSGFGPQICTSGQKIDDCPPDNLKPIPVLKGLASFLKENGYGPLPAAAEALTH